MSGAQSAVAIVGGGLAGLVAAWRLRQRGVEDVVLFEARAAVGGRICSVDPAGEIADPAVAARDRFDLGPSWFWPEVQPGLDRLVGELGLERFEAFDDGALLFERSPGEAPMRLQGYASSPPSARLAGATGALVTALLGRLDAGRVLTGRTVRRVRRIDAGVELEVEGAGGAVDTWCAERLLLALPPRLAAQRMVFDPPLPPELEQRWRATPTWMAPHAKYVAVYDAPFWRDQGLSGQARSAVGPMVEIHDVSMPGGHAALFGFVGVAAQVRRGLPDGALRAHCRAQLGRLFGAAAAAPRADALKDWAIDPLTATDADGVASGHHAEAPPRRADTGPWHGRLTGIGSEWSPLFPGYLAGAVDAAERGVDDCLATLPAHSTASDGAR